MSKVRKDSKGRLLRRGESYKKSKNLYQFVYTDIYGKRVYIYAKDLFSLREKEKLEQFNADQGIDTYVSGVATLDFLFQRFIVIKRNLRGTTISNYKYKYDHFIRDRLGRRKIKEFRYSDIYNFYLCLLQEDGLSIKTIEGVHSLMASLFKLAVRDNVILKNPCEGVWSEFRNSSKQEYNLRDALTVDQQKALLSALNKPENIRWRPVITVLIGTGCRISELVGLRWDDIDLDKGIIYINHTLNYYKDRVAKDAFKWELAPTKTESGKRLIPMLDEVKKAFLEEKERQDKTGIHCTFEIDGISGFLFCNKFTGPLSSSSLNKALKRIVDDYNADEELRAARNHVEPLFIPHVSCHNMRHTFATRLCENETNLKVIQSIMGHKDITTTMNIYADVNEKQKVDSIQKLSKQLHLFGESV